MRERVTYDSDSWNRTLAWVTLKPVTLSRHRAAFHSASIMYRRKASAPHRQVLLSYPHNLTVFTASTLIGDVKPDKTYIINISHSLSLYTSVLWHCWLGDKEGHPTCKKVVCWFADGDNLTGALHILYLQLSPPPPSSLAGIKSSNKIQNGDSLVPAYLGCHGNGR